MEKEIFKEKICDRDHVITDSIRNVSPALFPTFLEHLFFSENMWLAFTRLAEFWKNQENLEKEFYFAVSEFRKNQENLEKEFYFAVSREN